MSEADRTSQALRIKARIAEIAPLREALRAQGLGECLVAGDYHEYELGAPLREAEIAAFEARVGLRLPDGYRAFLSVVGNGGMGPVYGLYSVNEMSEERVRDDEESRQWRRRDFPFTESHSSGDG